MPTRTPPIEVVRRLRREVNFQCPVRQCGNPFMMIHHFDPPWAEENHHRPEGMIALCYEHAHKADHGSFTNEQLRDLKTNPNRGSVQGSFDWRRTSLLARIGGCYYTNPKVVLAINRHELVSFSHDEDGFLSLNLILPDREGNALVEIVENLWTISPAAMNLECPPHGRLLKIKLDNGDWVRIEFFSIETSDDLVARDKHAPTDGLEFPLALVEVSEHIERMSFSLGPSMSNFMGFSMNGTVNSSVRDTMVNDNILHVGVDSVRIEQVIDQVFDFRTATVNNSGNYFSWYLTDFIRCRFVGPGGVWCLGGHTTNECKFIGTLHLLDGAGVSPQPPKLIQPTFYQCRFENDFILYR